MSSILRVAGLFIFATAVVAASAQIGLSQQSPSTQTTMSQDELNSLDRMARADLVQAAAIVPFRARIPAEPPTGYYFSHVVFDRAHPEQGFAIWMQTLNATDRGLHIIEAPDMPDAEKNTLNLPGLTAVSLPNGIWMTLQKTDDPWMGLWIYATVLNGVHIEVDGANRMLVESVAGSL